MFFAGYLRLAMTRSVDGLKAFALQHGRFTIITVIMARRRLIGVIL